MRAGFSKFRFKSALAYHVWVWPNSKNIYIFNFHSDSYTVFSFGGDDENVPLSLRKETQRGYLYTLYGPRVVRC